MRSRDQGDPLITSTFCCVRFVNVAYFFLATTNSEKPGEKEEAEGRESREPAVTETGMQLQGIMTASARETVGERARNGAHELECSRVTNP